MSLRDLVTGWAQATCPSPDVQRGLLERFEHALQRGATYSFTIGRDLTKFGKPYLVYCFRGQFFAFELLPEQAARINVADNMVVHAEGAGSRPHGETAEPVVSLEEPVVDGAPGIDRLKPLTGTVRYRSEQHLFGPLEIRAMYDPPGRATVTNYHRLFKLAAPGGDLKFSLAPFGDLPDQAGSRFRGVLPLFFQIWTKVGSNPSSAADPFAPSLPEPAPPQNPHVGFVAGYQPMTGIVPAAFKPFKPGAFEPLKPTPTHFPPPYDPASQGTPVLEEKPLSDIRAVLLDFI